MASAIGIALISTILEPMAAKAMTMVVNKVCGVVNIKRDISRLQTTLRMIKSIVREAEEKQIDNVHVQNWLHDLIDIAYEARDVLDDFITYSSIPASKPVNFISSLKLSCFCGSSSDTSNIPLRILNQLEKDIRSVNERFDEKKKEGETVKTLISVVVAVGGPKSVGVDRRPEVGPFINKQRDALFLGRGDMKEGIMEKIVRPSDDNRVHVVAIWGMGGIGKTTLAQSIYNDERVKEDDYPTENRRWLCVGVNKFSAEKVIKEIVNDQNTIGIGNLQTKLVKELRRDRFLIVLDDVWHVDGYEWDLLFNPLTEVAKGGLIIITTRKREVCTATKAQKTYDLEPLSEEDSWSIFKSCAYFNGKSDSTPDRKGIGKKIVKKLNGLPLALKVVGCSLLDKDSSTWTKFLEFKLTKDDEVMSALRWSYNHLPSHLKTCFTYCALFPKDHVLDKKVLVEMWMAHDLIQKEDVGADKYFKELVDASLLQCVDGKHVMHDLIHDLALLVSNGEFGTANGSVTNDQMEKVRHITITHDGDYSKIPRLCKIKKLLTLYTTDYERYTTENSVLDDVFKQLKSIRVLVLVSFKITDIPDCISKLKHLRYLDVSQTRVKRLPDSLCHLYNLQMIAAPLNISGRVELPIDIVNISSLRYVRASLSTCKGVGKLTSLRELSSIHVCEGDNIRELGDMQRLRGKLTIIGLRNVTSSENATGALMEKQTDMEELTLVFNQHFAESIISNEEVLDALGCPPNLMYLKIVGYTGVKSPSWMVDGKHKFDKLQTLELYNCPKLESLQPLGELASLKHLSLQKVGVKRLGEIFYGKFTNNKVFFPYLESLSFVEMEEWEEWDDIIIENSSVSFFPSLSRLEIKVCAKLVSVLPVVKKWEDDEHPIMNAANFMTSLSSLAICDCNGLKRVQLDALVSLKELEIKRCSSLVQITSAICESLEISSCRLLEKMDVARCNSLVIIKILKVKGCESLRSLSIDIHGLDSLERLDIKHCPKLELAFEDGSSSSSSSGNSVAVPLNYIIIDNTQVFRTLLHHDLISLEYLDITNLEGFENFGENFCKSRLLKGLYISQCKDLKSLPADFHKLSSLVELYIIHCPQLQSLPADFHRLSSLENLAIRDCPQLQSLPPDFHKFSSLKILRIKDCPQLQSLPPDFHMLSSLERLSIGEWPQLHSLPPNFHKLSSLGKLHINHCPQLHSLPPDFHKLSTLKILGIRHCPQLHSLPPDFHKLSSLKDLCIDGCPELQSLPPDFHKLSSLKNLCIDHWPQLQSLPPDFHKLSSLEVLNIYDCPQLQSLSADGFPPSLRNLNITGCPLLHERCKEESGLDWHKIKHIPYKMIFCEKGEDEFLPYSFSSDLSMDEFDSD